MNRGRGCSGKISQAVRLQANYFITLSLSFPVYRKRVWKRKIFSEYDWHGPTIASGKPGSVGL